MVQRWLRMQILNIKINIKMSKFKSIKFGSVVNFCMVCGKPKQIEVQVSVSVSCQFKSF